eukprot:SAG31_NODE_942_length_10853_cov_24.620420_4_plen_57_part_00
MPGLDLEAKVSHRRHWLPGVTPPRDLVGAHLACQSVGGGGGGGGGGGVWGARDLAT